MEVRCEDAGVTLSLLLSLGLLGLALHSRLGVADPFLEASCFCSAGEASSSPAGRADSRSAFPGRCSIPGRCPRHCLGAGSALVGV